MEENRPHYCPVCGGLDFFKDCGYFYCHECQTQCEEIREQVFDDQGIHDDDDNAGLIGTPFKVKKPKHEKKRRKGDDLTSWEMFNFVLRGLVEELMSVGAPSDLKNTVMQLWTYYLKKSEAAFISKDEKCLPKLGICYKSEDVRLLYGLKKKKAKKYQRCSSMNVDLNTTISSLRDWSSMQMKRKFKAKAKKALMNKVAELSILDLESNADKSDILSMSDFNDSLVSTADPEPSFPAKLERTEIAKRRICKRTGGIYDETLNLPEDAGPSSLSRYKLLVILYLGLMYEGSKIQISDILRWVREGHLSFYEGAKYLPDTCFVQGKYNNLFNLTAFSPVYRNFLVTANEVVKFVEMVEWPVPNLYELAKKYVRELQLPVEFAGLIVHFENLMPPKYSFSERPPDGIPNYEARILAMLIIILKLLFGLDGRTEKLISNAASQLNKILKKKRNGTQGTKLFVWNDWVKQIICRSAVLSKYHFPTKHILCPETYGNSQSFINYCKKWKDSNAGLMNKYNFLCDSYLRDVHPAMVNTIVAVLNKLEGVKNCRTEDIDYPQCFTPYSTYIQKVLETSTKIDEPLIDEGARKILTEDFSSSDITYLLRPDLMKSIAEDIDYCFKIKKKSAQKKYAKFQYKNMSLGKIQMVKDPRLVAVTECGKFSRTRKNLLICFEKDSINENEKKKSKEEPKANHNANINFSSKLMKIDEHEVVMDCDKYAKMLRRKALRMCSKDGRNITVRKKKQKKKKSKERPKKNSDLNVNFSLKLLKRKRGASSGIQKKRKKRMKSVKMYMPSSQYWVQFEKHEIVESEFDTYICHRFPFSFSWLLGECAFVSEMSKFAIYKEILRIEKCFRSHFK